ncbi:MAG: 16S rRNA (cytidine(1402)-2'-O)-methyltransferase [Firmicutes bacterium]|nr:16S rRNA (cytidine(1402)-2'-O)-methyltransferase [Bacillota bacterium]MDD4336333.1 16S rRNA (cytidine(1402)-2'-O)-methyltransferase [Bacillota bacterium]MDD4792804.1 16S rRNA (cytidine(1402)-2'-O)-methyltransferase [Bacillota bacterium]
MNQDGEAPEKGTLYLVATPIGNMADITERARTVLAEADYVAAEDTRHTGLLLHRLDIDARLLSYHEHNEAARAEQIIAMLDRGEDVAVVSDAGMPGISDPGEVIVAAAAAQGFRVVPVPGPSAFVAALTASGLPTSRFFFQGFLPRKAGERRKTLKQLSSIPVTLVFYEAPHRLTRMLRDVAAVLGDRRCVVARELTKKFEEIRRGTVDEMLEWAGERKPKGEMVVMVDGCAQGGPAVDCREPERQGRLRGMQEGNEAAGGTDLIGAAAMEAAQLVADGWSMRDAASEMAKAYGVPRREVYNRAHDAHDELRKKQEGT